MNIVHLDGRNWKTALDFMGALRIAIGAPDWHGWSVDAFMDSMIWGGINSVEPPYAIAIENAAGLPDDVREEIGVLSRALREHREAYRQQHDGKDVRVTMEILP